MRSNINLNLKSRLLKTYIFSVVGYGSEAWTYSKVIKEKLHASEMWCYRRILKISWIERVTNKKVLETIGHQRVLVNEMIKRKMRFDGHIIRGSSACFGKACSRQGLFLARIVLEGMTDGKRDRARQRRTWGDDVKEWGGYESIGRAKRYFEDRGS